MSTETKIPDGPGDMPIELRNSERWLSNTIASLRHFLSVTIAWEKDVAESNAAGESVGEWSVEIVTRKKSFRVQHEDLVNALWFAHLRATEAHAEYWEQRDQARKSALAKLNPADLRALGYRSS